jgi:mannose-6-phosphate isomerase-like protein (cupin superfamily)
MKKNIFSLPSFTAGDETIIRELLHPKNDPVPLGYSLAHAEVPPGAASLPHRLHGRSETYLLLEGEGQAYIDGQAYDLQKDELLYIPAGAEQYIRNTGAGVLRFLCIVDPPWSAETEEVDK